MVTNYLPEFKTLLLRRGVLRWIPMQETCRHLEISALHIVSSRVLVPERDAPRPTVSVI